MSLPPFLFVELRHAFRACAPRGTVDGRRFFAVHRSRLQRLSDQSTKAPISQRTGRDGQKAYTQSDADSASLQDTPSSRDVVRKEPHQQDLSDRSRQHVPLKVIPRAQLTPNLTLSPQQRLHIEQLTRRAPQLTRERSVYKEKLLIYHFGTGREKFLILLKFAAIFTAGFVEAIVVPAHIVAGTSWWLVGLFSISGLLPFATIHALTKPWVTRIFLHLPPHARQTPKTAMDYARNLPGNAMLDIEYLRPVPLSSKITASVFDLAPANEWWKMVTFKWTGHRAHTGSFLSRNPTEFYVKPGSSGGKAARFTVPGVWTSVYRRLTGTESGSVSRWRR